MKNAFGLILFGLIAAGVGAAATVFALKKRDELEQYEDYDDEKFYDDCDCNCDECDGCEEIFDEDDDAADEGADMDVDKGIDAIQEATDDLAKLDGATEADF